MRVQGMTQKMGLYLPEAQRQPTGEIAQRVEVIATPCVLCDFSHYCQAAHWPNDSIASSTRPWMHCAQGQTTFAL